MAKLDHCVECGHKEVRPVAKAGRFRHYKGLDLEVPASVSVLTCTKCGEEYFDAAAAKTMDEAMEAVYRKMLRKNLDELLGRFMNADVPLRRIEGALGLSEGYLSKAKQGRSEPSAQLVAALALLERDPDGGMRTLGGLWSTKSGSGRGRAA